LVDVGEYRWHYVCRTPHYPALVRCYKRKDNPQRETVLHIAERDSVRIDMRNIQRVHEMLPAFVDGLVKKNYPHLKYWLEALFDKMSV
jgi:hypothetical protein